MKKLTVSFLVIAAATAIYSVITASQLAAQSISFSNIVPFSTSVGRIGFFDQGNGKLYIYDGDGKTCLFSGQLKELGKPFEPLSTTGLTQHPVKNNAKITYNEKGEKTVTLNNP
jgi:hypothetical protein